MGRPTSLAFVVRRDDQDQPITVADIIIQWVRAGQYIEAAAAAAGVTKQSVYQWMHDGAAANTRHEKGAKLGDFSRYERLAMTFSDSLAEAEGIAEVEALDGIARMAAGGGEVRTTTTRTLADGKVEETVRVEELAPSVAAALWRAERRWQTRWGRKERLEVSGPDGEPIPVEVRAARIREAAEQLDANRPELTVVSENGQVNG